MLLKFDSEIRSGEHILNYCFIHRLLVDDYWCCFDIYLEMSTEQDGVVPVVEGEVTLQSTTADDNTPRACGDKLEQVGGSNRNQYLPPVRVGE